MFKIGLLPTENWQYSLADLVRGWAASISSGLEEETISLPGLGKCLPVRSGRAGIAAALRALNLGRGARVAVPLYCCPVVFKAIVAADCTPTFVDVEADTFCMSASDLAIKRSQVEAVIAVHMFGNLCDVPRLQLALPGKPVIEDCAQAIRSTLNGRVAGSFGAIAVFSFRSGKYLSVGEGGAVLGRTEELNFRLSSAIRDLPRSTPIPECIHVVKTYLRSTLRCKSLWGITGYPLWQIYNHNVEFSNKCPVVLGRIYRADLATTRRRLATLEAAIERQRANADHYASSLQVSPGMLCTEKPGAFYNRFQYPVSFGSREACRSVAAYLFDRGVDTTTPLRDIPEVAATHFGYRGDCPVAERLARQVLVIPSHSGLTRIEVERIARLFNQGWSTLNKEPRHVSGQSNALSGRGIEVIRNRS